MIERPQVPPAYRLVTLTSDIDLGSEARRMAVEGADDGTLLWVTRDDQLDCAVILHPDDPLERAPSAAFLPRSVSEASEPDDLPRTDDGS